VAKRGCKKDRYLMDTGPSLLRGVAGRYLSLRGES